MLRSFPKFVLGCFDCVYVEKKTKPGKDGFPCKKVIIQDKNAQKRGDSDVTVFFCEANDLEDKFLARVFSDSSIRHLTLFNNKRNLYQTVYHTGKNLTNDNRYFFSFTYKDPKDLKKLSLRRVNTEK